MVRVSTAAVIVVLLSGLWCRVEATNRYYSDILAKSPSGKYKVIAESPDNKIPHKPFQSSFVYTCTEKESGKVLWTRKQPMKERNPSDEGKVQFISFPSEGSPVHIFVSDEGWTVVRTGWNELIVVDIHGNDRCCLHILKEGFTNQENAEYVRRSSAGPQWTGCSLWYFLNVEERHLFVIRPWWGRRLVVDLGKGELVKETDDIKAASGTYEREYVMAVLSKNEGAVKMWSRRDGQAGIREAAYLAGCLEIKEAVPPLEKLQDSTYSCGYSMGGSDWMNPRSGDVSPFCYRTYSIRQAAQLSLRRLGKTPKPCTPIVLEVLHPDPAQNFPYTPGTSSTTKMDYVQQVKTGMGIVDVVGTIGSPDYVDYPKWEYDIDADEPYTLVLTWKDKKIVDIEKVSPPRWKEGLVRDREIVGL